jgi:anhydro-N-acetylmuramic acid kinase
MSGTSIDGLDLCACHFTFDKQWEFEIVETETTPYTKIWQNQLLEAENCSGRRLTQIHCKYGSYLGKQSANFIQKNKLSIDLVASHGHTIFHQPKDGYTLQIGHGGYLCSETNLPSIVDFRSQDIALGGEGAPLVPFGEKELFPTHSCFLNLGGIANLSIHSNEDCIAFDVTAANMVLNYLCKKHFDLSYDKGGKLASNGQTNSDLFNQLNAINYFSIKAPKSLGKEDVFRWIIPCIDAANISAEDKLNTFVAHLCFQIQNTLEVHGASTEDEILVSGGGALNTFLIHELQQTVKIKLPEKNIIEYKEALIFAFLGLSRLLEKPNVLNSVTGARKPVSAGSIFLP